MMAASRLTGAITRRCVSSHAMPPQCSPPMLPGTVQAALQAGRREHAVVSQACGSAPGMPRARPASRPTRPPRSSACATRLAGFDGKGCVGAVALPGHVARRAPGRSTIGKCGAPLIRWKRTRSRSSSPTATLGAAPCRGTAAAERGDVVVPEVVVHGLERPHHVAGRGAQRDHGVGVDGCRPAAGRRSNRGWRCHRRTDHPVGIRRYATRCRGAGGGVGRSGWTVHFSAS